MSEKCQFFKVNQRRTYQLTYMYVNEKLNAVRVIRDALHSADTNIWNKSIIVITVGFRCFMKGLKLLKSFKKAKTFLSVRLTWLLFHQGIPEGESFAMKEFTCLFIFFFCILLIFILSFLQMSSPELCSILLRKAALHGKLHRFSVNYKKKIIMFV